MNTELSVRQIERMDGKLNEADRNPADLIARATRREREKAGLSLSALAQTAGLAKSTLSQLEAGKGNPSIETLWAIANALRIPFSHLFETSALDVTMVRADQGATVENVSADMLATLLSSCPPASRRDLYRVVLKRNPAREADPHPKGTIEHAFIAEGRVRLGPLEHVESLGPGDYYRYPADIPHLYEALSDTALILLVMDAPG